MVTKNQVGLTSAIRKSKLKLIRKFFIPKRLSFKWKLTGINLKCSD